MLARQIVDQFAPGLFGRVTALLVVMAPFARAELEQIGRKMAHNEYFGASPDCCKRAGQVGLTLFAVY